MSAHEAERGTSAMSGTRPGKKNKSVRKPVDAEAVAAKRERRAKATAERLERERRVRRTRVIKQVGIVAVVGAAAIGLTIAIIKGRSEEHTSELQSLMRISSAVFCLKKKKTHKQDLSRLVTYN